MTTNPWSSTVLPRKTVELIGVALNAACTNLNPEGTRRHIRAALRAGASRDEILLVLKWPRCCRSIRAVSARPFSWKRPRRLDQSHCQTGNRNARLRQGTRNGPVE